jgi:aldose 1-epimerase
MPGAHRLAAGQAIHGLGLTRAWSVERQAPDGCSLLLDLGGLWPLGGRARQEISLLDAGIEMSIELEATGAAFPAGAGWHPWFRCDAFDGCEPSVTLRSGTMYELGPDSIPTGALIDVDAAHDLRDGPALGDRRIDACYAAVSDPIVVRWGSFELNVTSSANVRYAVVYTPEHAFCVEPQTCAIDAFNLAARGVEGTGVVVVERSKPFVAWTRWTWRE